MFNHEVSFHVRQSRDTSPLGKRREGHGSRRVLHLLRRKVFVCQAVSRAKLLVGAFKLASYRLDRVGIGRR